MQSNALPAGAVQTTAVTPNITNTSDAPEWLRVPDACRRFSVRRSWLYTRIMSGEIKSVCLRNRGSMHGVRLISRDSLAAFIESRVIEGVQ